MNLEFFPEVFSAVQVTHGRVICVELRIRKMRIPANKIAASQTIASGIQDDAEKSKTAENTEKIGPNPAFDQSPTVLAAASYSARQKSISGPPIVQVETSAVAIIPTFVVRSGGPNEDLFLNVRFPIAQIITVRPSNHRVVNITANPIVRSLTDDSIPASMIMGQLLAVVKTVWRQEPISIGKSSALPPSCATNKNCNASRSSDSGA